MSRASTLAAARERLRAPVKVAQPLWPALGAASLAACAALSAAAAVILGGPALGTVSQTVLPPVSHVVER